MIPDMVIRTAAVAPFYKNGYVVSCETTRDAVLIDPGDEVDALLAAVRDYTSRNGMSFGFFSKLLNDAGANTALED